LKTLMRTGSAVRLNSDKQPSHMMARGWQYWCTPHQASPAATPRRFCRESWLSDKVSGSRKPATIRNWTPTFPFS
jgi:hypothetical protein